MAAPAAFDPHSPKKSAHCPQKSPADTLIWIRSAGPENLSGFVPVYDRILWNQSERTLARDGLTRAADAS